MQPPSLRHPHLIHVANCLRPAFFCADSALLLLAPLCEIRPCLSVTFKCTLSVSRPPHPPLHPPDLCTPPAAGTEPGGPGPCARWAPPSRHLSAPPPGPAGCTRRFCCFPALPGFVTIRGTASSLPHQILSCLGWAHGTCLWSANQESRYLLPGGLSKYLRNGGDDHALPVPTL